jgi:HTH-type transcriptional regulator, fmd operon transcriptional regulator
MRESKKDTFLTDLQVEVLTMTKNGMSQTEIARKMGTTRGNICILLNSALGNVEKAKKTLDYYNAIQAPVFIVVPAGCDIYEILDILIAAAEKNCIKICIDPIDILVKIKTEVSNKLKGRLIIKDINVSIDSSGSINIF